MTVKILKTGEAKEFNDSYGMRLIEQGKAVAVQPAPKKTAVKKGEEA